VLNLVHLRDWGVELHGMRFPAARDRP